MKTITTTGFIHMIKKEWMDAPRYDFFSHDDMHSCGYALVCPHTLTFELPDGFDPTQAQLKALNAKKQNLADDYNARVQQINDEISKLQSLTYSGGHELAREAAERTGETPLEGHLA